MPMHYTSCLSVYGGPEAESISAFQVVKCALLHSFYNQHYLLNPIYVHFLYTFKILVALT